MRVKWASFSTGQPFRGNTRMSLAEADGVTLDAQDMFLVVRDPQDSDPDPLIIPWHNVKHAKVAT